MSNSEGATSVFLCHNVKDKPAVRRLEKRLGDHGIRTFLDEVDLMSGTNWMDSLLERLNASQVIIICLGPNGFGDWQKREVDIAVSLATKSKTKVIPLILPDFVESQSPTLQWLADVQAIDLRKDETDTDPFGRLLASFTSFKQLGHYRPTVVVLQNSEEETSKDACQRIVSGCRNVLHRVIVLDYEEPLLEQRLSSLFQYTDVFVSLLAPNAFTRRLGSTFHEGVVAGAETLAKVANVAVTSWRSKEMQLPDVSAIVDRFRSSNIETVSPAEFARHVISTAESLFEPGPSTTEGTSLEYTQKRTVLGVPPNDDKFPRLIADELKNHRIRCDALGKWERIKTKLSQGKSRYDALIVILNGDREWRDDCEVWLDALQEDAAVHLPAIGAYCHRVDNREDASPIPFDLDQFQEYFGKKDLPKLADRINRGNE